MMQARRWLRACVTTGLAVTAAVAMAQARLCSELAPAEREAARASGACRDAASPDGGSPEAAWLRAPNVVGMPLRAAQARLEGFNVERTERASPAPSGYVIEQIPRPSARMLPGQSVLLIVSTGAAGADAPDAARDAKARPPATKARTSARPQAPVAEPRAEVEERAPAVEGPAAAPETVLPDVVGRSSVEASLALAQFKVEPIEIVADAAPSGQVLAQSPAPGTAVAPGSGVALRLSDGSLAPSVAPVPAAAPPPDRAPAAETDTPAGAMPSQATLLLLAGILIGTAFGALLMRQWALSQPSARTARAADPTAPASTPQADAPVATAAPAPHVVGNRVAARLERGETKVEFLAPGDPAADPEERPSE